MAKKTIFELELCMQSAQICMIIPPHAHEWGDFNEEKSWNGKFWREDSEMKRIESSSWMNDGRAEERFDMIAWETGNFSLPMQSDPFQSSKKSSLVWCVIKHWRRFIKKGTRWQYQPCASLDRPLYARWQHHPCTWGKQLEFSKLVFGRFSSKPSCSTIRISK